MMDGAEQYREKESGARIQKFAGPHVLIDMVMLYVAARALSTDHDASDFEC